jgi:Xaa-Pro aminopeptidase
MHLLKPSEVTPGTELSEYRARRDRLLKEAPANSLLIVSGAPETMMTNDIPWPFRQRSDFRYLTGFLEPEATLALTNVGGRNKHLLFCRERDSARELWDGPRTGPENVSSHFAMDEGHHHRELQQVLASLIRQAGTRGAIFSDLPDNQLHQLLQAAEGGVPSTQSVTTLVERHRLIKSPSECNIMRRAGQVSGEAMSATMQMARPGILENMLEVTMEYESRKRGASRLAYPPVVANGLSNNTLHYIANDDLIGDGNLILMDAGAEVLGYSGDITRTFPATGKFTAPQAELYQLVLEVQKKCVDLCGVEGMTLRTLHRAHMDLLAAALRKVGLLSQASDLKVLCPHSIGHYLGMDVHDVSSIPSDVPFRPGMIVTVEPGVYVPDDPRMPARFRGLGIRIEDDVLVTPTGPEILTSSVPKEIRAIEALMAQGRN